MAPAAMNVGRRARISATHFPYFDFILEKLEAGEPSVEQAFGRHVHWGHWPDPERTTGSPDDFAAAAESLTRYVIAVAHISDDQRILDAGCGFGGTLASVNESFAAMDLTGLNIDPRQIARAQAKVRARPGNRLRFVEGDACAMPLSDRYFDVVLAVECIFHFPDRKKFFDEAWRVLEPGGILAISDFVPRRFFRGYTASRLNRSLLRHLFGRVHMDYTIDDYRTLAADTGFAPLVEADVTEGTLPTYPFLRRLLPAVGRPEVSNALGSHGAEWASRLGWIGYRILSWRKVSRTVGTPVT